MTVSAAHRLNGALVKYDRGAKHHAEVAAIANRYREGGASIFTEGEGRDAIYRVRLGDAPPPEFGAAIGDFLHNMRSSLDLIACCFVQHFDPAASLANVQFPIGDLAKPLTAKERKRLADIQALVEIAETFRRRHPKPLAALQALSNQDKHRLITTAATRAQVARVEIDEASNTAKFVVTPDNDLEIWSRPLQDGDVFAVGKLPGMGVNFTLALVVDREALPFTVLNSILWAVGDMLGFAQNGSWTEQSAEA